MKSKLRRLPLSSEDDEEVLEQLLQEDSGAGDDALQGNSELGRAQKYIDQSILMTSRDRPDMEHGASSPLFKRKQGCFVSRNVGILIATSFLGALLLVGLLVFYLAPRTPGTDSGASVVPIINPAKHEPIQRLPTALLPDSYAVQLQPFVIEKNFTTLVNMTVIFNCTEDTNNITINALNLTIDGYRLDLVSGNASTPRIIEVTDDLKNQFKIFTLDGPLRAGNQYGLTMNVTSILNDLLAGFYRSNYTEANTTKWLAVTQFEPTDARRAFPCFDEPAMKATFDITIIHQENMNAISNGPSLGKVTREDGWIIETYGTTPKMSTYLVAFVVSELVPYNPDDMEFKVWARKDAIQNAEFAQGYGPKIINYYNEFFGIPYPMNKTDLAAVPDFNAGAMENWGLVIFRETSLLYDPQLSSASNLQNIAQTVAHELGHQWFGNLVTMKWWDDLWLNEGFATYMEYVGTNHIYPEWKMLQQFVTAELQPTMELDSLKTSHPISVKVDSPEDINELFDSISYGKGGSVIRMMQHFLGNETFLLGLQDYLNTSKYSNAESKDLWTHLQEAQTVNITDPAFVDVVTVMNLWTNQTGYPVVSVTLNPDNTLNVTQKRFFLDSSNITEEERSVIWHVPLTYATQDDPLEQWSTDTKEWLTEQQMTLNMTVDLSQKWFIFNVEEVGFYRVNYDSGNWMRLLEQLQTDHEKIPVENRAQIIDDAFSLAEGYELSYEVALNTTLYLQKELDYLPWSAVLSKLGGLSYSLCRSENYGNFKTYIYRLIKPLYEYYGWRNTSSESVLIQFAQSSAIATACKYGHVECRSNATELFNKWKNDPTDRTIIHPNLRSTVYCQGINLGTTEDWDFVWAAYKKEQIPSEKTKLLSALGCTSQMWLLSRYLQLSLDSSKGVPSQDGTSVISQVLASDYGRELAFNFIQENWNNLYNIYGLSTFSFSNLVTTMGARLNTPFEVEQFLWFSDQVARNNTIGSAKRAFAQALESANANVRFLRENYDNITQWLELAVTSYLKA